MLQRTASPPGVLAVDAPFPSQGIFNTPVSSSVPELPYIIAHLSDPHLSRRHYPEHIKSFKALLRAVLDAGCDHVVITGDIVSTAEPDDYHLAREVLGTYGLLDASRLTVVPGNHDIFGGPHRAPDVLHFPKQLRSVDYERTLALFEEAFAETFTGVRRLQAGMLYPFLKDAGPFGIIGVNSTMPWSLSGNPFGSNGRLGAGQLEALRTLRELDALRTRVPVVAIHHHLLPQPRVDSGSSMWNRIEDWTMRLHGRRRVLRTFADAGVRHVLHGHVHCNAAVEQHGVATMNGAGAICDDPIRFLKYNVLRHADGMTTSRINVLSIPCFTPVSARSIHRFHSVEPQAQLVEAT
jgi:3',5'-cyclic AMP phosphodiesterase CpdA